MALTGVRGLWKSRFSGGRFMGFLTGPEGMSIWFGTSFGIFDSGIFFVGLYDE